MAPIKEENGAAKARKTSKFNNNKKESSKHYERCCGLCGLNNSLLL